MLLLPLDVESFSLTIEQGQEFNLGIEDELTESLDTRQSLKNNLRIEDELILDLDNKFLKEVDLDI